MPKRIPLWLNIILVFCLISTGCDKKSNGAMPPDLTAQIESFYSAIDQDDTATRIGLFAEDAIMMPNHWTLFKGIEEISQVVKGDGNTVFKIRDRRMIDFDISGNMAYTVNSYNYTYHAIDEEARWHKTKNVHIWKKNPHGTWQLYLDIWNSDIPISQFSEE